MINCRPFDLEKTSRLSENFSIDEMSAALGDYWKICTEISDFNILVYQDVRGGPFSCWNLKNLGNSNDV